MGEGVVIEVEFLKYLIWVVCEAISSFELSFFEESFFEFEVAVAIVEGSFDGIVEYLVCF